MAAARKSANGLLGAGDVDAAADVLEETVAALGAELGGTPQHLELLQEYAEARPERTTQTCKSFPPQNH